MKCFYLFLLLLFCVLGEAQTDTLHFIKVHFLYGSKPKKEYRSKEFKAFGGIHGGHVSIQSGNMDYGFEPTYKVHLFPHHRNRQSKYTDNIISGNYRYDSTSKVTTFIIPLTTEQFNNLNRINQQYCKSTPYDYAFFGMRCASTAQDVLGQIGVLKKKNRFINILTTFYPKKLRKRMFSLAKKNNYTIIKTAGRTTRKWEKD